MNGERYITEELKNLEQEILTAGDRDKALEFEIFTALRESVTAESVRIQRAAGLIAELDTLCSLASVAVNNNYCRPSVDDSGVIEIHDGRHPVVERVLKDALFVPNDTYMGEREDRAAIITGPNMAGKSTYMRQVALITLMAQIGSFVPAKSARIGVVDRIFTRIGASDDLAGGQSTFMVEMTEVSEILHQATPRSLLILDEIGRGTSTFDGMSIARAVLEFCADPKKLGAKTLFATHYHELTELEGILPGVKNYSISIKKRGDELIFLRKIVPGGADRSYGIEVAKLAGLPNEVVKRANIILKELEQGGAYQAKPREETEQVSLDAIGEAEVLAAIRRAQPDTMSPIEAMQLLYELKQKLLVISPEKRSPHGKKENRLRRHEPHRARRRNDLLPCVSSGDAAFGNKNIRPSGGRARHHHQRFPAQCALLLHALRRHGAAVPLLPCAHVLALSRQLEPRAFNDAAGTSRLLRRE